MKKIILLIFILVLIFSISGCKVTDEPGYNFSRDTETFESEEGATLKVKISGFSPLIFDLKDYDYSFNQSDNYLVVRNLQTGEIWRFSNYTIAYLRITK